MKDTAHPAPTAADSVYRQLKKQIIARCRQPGDRLREETIAKELDVSRTPVREAIRRLTAEGLATLIPNAGARLVRPTREEIVDTYEVREHLECLAARKAAASVTPEQLDALQSLIDEEERIFEEKNFEAYLDVNNRFHRTLAAASGNPVLAEFYRENAEMMKKTVRYSRHTAPSEGLCGTSDERSVGMSVYWKEGEAMLVFANLTDTPQTVSYWFSPDGVSRMTGKVTVNQLKIKTVVKKSKKGK